MCCFECTVLIICGLFTLQSYPDSFHSEHLGIAKLLVQCIWTSLSEKSQEWLKKRISLFDMPPGTEKVRLKLIDNEKQI